MSWALLWVSLQREAWDGSRRRARSSSFCPVAPCHEGGFVAARLPWPTWLPQPGDPTCASTWGFGVLCHRASDCDCYVTVWGPSQRSLLLDGGGPGWDPHELVALTDSAKSRPRRPSGWGSIGWESTPAPCKGRRQCCLSVGAGQGVRDGQRSVALLVAVWHYLGSERWLSLGSLDAQPIHHLPKQLLTV